MIRSQINFDASQQTKDRLKRFRENNGKISAKVALEKMLDIAENAEQAEQGKESLQQENIKILGDLHKLQVEYIELKEVASKYQEELEKAKQKLNDSTAEFDAQKSELEEQVKTAEIKNDDYIRDLEENLKIAESRADDAIRELEDLRNDLEQPASEAYIADACTLLQCEPEELIQTITNLIDEGRKTTIVQEPIPDNSILLSDLTPFEKWLLEVVIRFSGAISAKELLIDRFFIPYQYYGNCDFKIRRMTASKLKLAKQKFTNLSQENND